MRSLVTIGAGLALLSFTTACETDRVQDTGDVEPVPETQATGPADPAAGAGIGLGDTVSVALDEYFIDIPVTLPAGRTVFRVSNAGDMEHGFAVEGDGVDAELPKRLEPGETGVLEVDLAPGQYTTLCPVAGHAPEGMRMIVQVEERQDQGGAGR